MVTDGPGMTAVICAADSAVAAALVHTVSDLYGMRITATAISAEGALGAVTRQQPDLVLMDLALCGQLGLRIIPALHAAAPGCAVVMTAPAGFAGMRLDAVASGAITLVETSDLRPLQCGIERLTHIHGDNCPSCAARDRETYWRKPLRGSRPR